MTRSSKAPRPQQRRHFPGFARLSGKSQALVRQWLDAGKSLPWIVRELKKTTGEKIAPSSLGRYARHEWQAEAERLRLARSLVARLQEVMAERGGEAGPVALELLFTGLTELLAQHQVGDPEKLAWAISKIGKAVVERERIAVERARVEVERDKLAELQRRAARLAGQVEGGKVKDSKEIARRLREEFGLTE